MSFSNWSDCVVIIAKELGVHVTKNNLSHLINQGGSRDELLENLTNYLKLESKKLNVSLNDVPTLLFPVFFPLKNGQAAVVYSVDDDIATVSFSITPDIKTTVTISDLTKIQDGDIWLITSKERGGLKKRIDTYLKPYEKNWLFALIAKDKKFYIQIALGALFGNMLALSSALFSMQVYDRVIPAQSYSTLWVLFFGVFIALATDMLLKLLRGRLADAIGKKTDLLMSGMFYSRALAIKNDARPNSTGAFIAQLREIEHIRELLTSTTVVAMVDMPFIIIFIGVIFSIGNLLALPVIAAIPLIIIPGIFIQWPLSRLSREGIRETAIRNSMLVETVEGLEDIKLLQAEDQFLRVWNECNASAAQISLEQRHWALLLTNWTQFIQQLVFICVVATGVFLVVDNSITTGTLIACSILSGRTVAPLGQLAHVLTRWQHAKMAKEGLDSFLERPIDRRQFQETLHIDQVKGDFSLKNIKYRFGEDAPIVLDVASFNIKAGEKIAILGPIGAGKSTLLRLLSGMAEPLEGELLLDGLSMRDLSVDDVRRDISYLSQNAHLFYGTIRENLVMGRPQTPSEDIVRALNIAGASSLLNNEQGLELTIAEGGMGLSGGQKQALLLARTLLRDNPVLFLDEPTASMDESLELHVIRALQEYVANKTLVIVTHRQAPLALVNRIIVMDKGKIVLDGPRNDVITKLRVA